MGRKILAVLAGIISSFVLVFLIDAIGHVVYPFPADLDFNNAEQMSAYVQMMPAGAHLLVLAAWIISTFVGSFITWMIAKEKPMMLASIIGILMMVASVITLVMIPHPAWFSISAVIGIILAAFLAGKVGQCKYPKAA